MKGKTIVPDITQTFYNAIAAHYEKFYQDWQSATRQEATFLSKIFRKHGFSQSARVLDCACGIGTQAIGLAALGYPVSASDISEGELALAQKRAAENKVRISFKQADFCALKDAFTEKFDIIIAMDNALPHMLSSAALSRAVKSIISQIIDGGLFVASIRDYDTLLKEKPGYSAPYVHKTGNGQRVLFQTWDWHGENYTFIQYIIEDEETTQVSKFECEYRATKREELTELIKAAGCREVFWELPEATGFYQPVVIAKK